MGCGTGRSFWGIQGNYCLLGGALSPFSLKSWIWVTVSGSFAIPSAAVCSVGLVEGVILTQHHQPGYTRGGIYMNHVCLLPKRCQAGPPCPGHLHSEAPQGATDFHPSWELGKICLSMWGGPGGARRGSGLLFNGINSSCEPLAHGFALGTGRKAAVDAIEALVALLHLPQGSWAQCPAPLHYSLAALNHRLTGGRKAQAKRWGREGTGGWKAVGLPLQTQPISQGVTGRGAVFSDASSWGRPGLAS